MGSEFRVDGTIPKRWLIWTHLKDIMGFVPKTLLKYDQESHGMGCFVSSHPVSTGDVTGALRTSPHTPSFVTPGAWPFRKNIFRRGERTDPIH